MPSRRGVVLAAGGLVLAVALTTAATLLPSPVPPPAPAPVPAAAAQADTALSATSARAAVDALNARLRRLPLDHHAWARLGAAYVQEARITSDPTLYARAQQALDRAAALAPGDPATLTGGAALAAARHDFAGAVRLADRAIAANPYGATAYGVLADAATQLGRYDAAAKAADRMIALRPGVSAYTRAAYAAELRGDPAQARRLLNYALLDAYAPEDVAYCRYSLGELSLHAGDVAAAAEQYQLALDAAPAFAPALAGRARAAALSGQLPRALDDYATLVARLPMPQYIIEYGETLAAAGRDPAPQWRLLAAQRTLMDAAAVKDDLTWAEFEADHGSPAKAVAYARAEYARHPNLSAADALAWALHRAGRDREALPYAVAATSTGWRNALVLRHRAAIERALGDTAAAARSTARAEAANPRFVAELPALARFS
ncbi:tetratricopeptide repeat protein [Nonomuraea sp. NPDC003804]|uniref:tetratricopeptide repeat protein n=1 Tax=Nonomuraea sp. NPDC003804 TaxID=3154547 RepID=UPI0033AC020B